MPELLPVIVMIYFLLSRKCHVEDFMENASTIKNGLENSKYPLSHWFLCTTRNLCLVPRAGIEPARSHPHRILNPARLPVPPPRQRINIIRKVVTKSQFIFKGVLTVVN